MWNLKRNDTNKLTKQNETHRLRKWTYGCQREGTVRKSGKVMDTLLYSKWTTNKYLLYRTCNSTQCYVPGCIRGGLGEWIHVYVLLSPFAVHPIVNIVNRLYPNTKLSLKFGGKKIWHIYRIEYYSVIKWRRRWHPTPVLLPGKSHGWRSLVGCHLWGHTESDTTEAT